MAVFVYQETQAWLDDLHVHRILRWLFPTLAVAALSLFALATFLVYWIGRTRNRAVDDDPYAAYVAGVIAYGAELHRQQRDPAVLRLRENTSLTLHVLGFHSERVQLGGWALESAQFLDSRIDIVSILIDDLGWANYLLGNDQATVNIEKAIRFAEQFPEGADEPLRSVLLAKAHRHLGVIQTERTKVIATTEFDAARSILRSVEPQSPEVRTNLGHVSYAEALAIATMLEVNSRGTLRHQDIPGRQQLAQALQLTRDAKNVFHDEHDQGRYAKTLVLEVRILEGLQQVEEARQLSALRDRAVAASVWARPAGAVFITGR